MIITLLILCAVAYGLYALLRKPKQTNNSKIVEPIKFTIPNEMEIKGAAFNICKQLDVWEGSFNGYLRITYSEHDEYAVGIYRNDNILVGWLPKKPIAVYNYLKKNKIKQLPCNGYFTYQQYRENTVHFKTHLPL